MPRYMIQASYTAQAKAAFAKGPQDRAAAVKSALEKLEGKLISLDYSLGEYDVVAIYEAPDDTTALALALVGASPGHLANLKTTKLFSQAEMNEASRKASKQSFEGVSSSS